MLFRSRQDVEPCADSAGPTPLRPPIHEPDDEVERPGIMAADRASLEDIPTSAVKPGPAEHESSGYISWEEVKAYADLLLAEPPPPRHEAGDELEWSGTMAAYRASMEAAAVVVDDDLP